MNEAQLRQWVEANPGRINNRDRDGNTPLYVAVRDVKSLPLVAAGRERREREGTTSWGSVPLHFASSLDILTALMDRGADATVPSSNRTSLLMIQSLHRNVENLPRLLQDPRLQATIGARDSWGNTALHVACHTQNNASAASILKHLLQAGMYPALTNDRGETPLIFLRQRHPTHHAAIALLEQAQKDAEKTSLLVKARRLVVVSRNTVAPSYLQGRVARGQPLPRVTLMPVTDGQNENDDEEEEEDRKLRTLMAFLLGIEGGWKNAGMPRNVFRGVLDLLLPTWDPLRRKNADLGPPSVQ